MCQDIDVEVDMGGSVVGRRSAPRLDPNEIPTHMKNPMSFHVLDDVSGKMILRESPKSTMRATLSAQFSLVCGMHLSAGTYPRENNSRQNLSRQRLPHRFFRVRYGSVETGAPPPPLTAR